MTSSLFREEALEHRKDRLYGDVILLQPLSLTVLVGVVVVICALVLGILFWGTYARKETVVGYLLPDKGIVKSYPLQVGTVSRIDVKEGDEVHEGQTLVTILSEQAMQGGGDIATVQLNEIESTLAHQLERIDSEKNLEQSQTLQLNAQIQNLKNELTQIQQSIKSQQDRVQLLENRVASVKKLLEHKNISQLDYQKILDEYLSQQQRYQELLSAQSTKQSALSQVQTELQQLPLKTKSRIHEIENNISELKHRAADIQGRRGLEIRSPVDGTITALSARLGQIADPRVPLLAIIPKDASMQAELFLPSRAIGFIAPGQSVRIRYDAFPFRRFGIYEGEVLVISKHVLLPQELPIPLPDLKEPVYRITVKLNAQQIKAYGKSYSLQAGMSLKADIILERQTLLQWILDPFLSLRGKM